MQNTKRNTMGGKLMKHTGWVVALSALVYTIIGYVDISSDASTKAFAPLVFIEGSFFIGIGLIIAWFGHKKIKNSSL